MKKKLVFLLSLILILNTLAPAATVRTAKADGPAKGQVSVSVGPALILQKEVAEGAYLHVCYMYSRVGRSARFAVAPGRRGLAVCHGRRSARGALPRGAPQPNGVIR